VEADESRVHQAEVIKQKKAALDALFEDLDFRYRLAALIGDDTAEAVRVNREQADVISEVFSRLVGLRERMRSDLARFVSQVEQTGSQLQYASEAENDEAEAMHALVAEAHELARADLLRVADDIANLESELVETFAKSPLLKRASKMIESYQFDGVLSQPTARRTGNASRRLRKDCVETFEAVLPVVEAVYADQRFVGLDAASFVSELMQKLAGDVDPSLLQDPAHEIRAYADFVANAGKRRVEWAAFRINSLRWLVNPRAPTRSTADALTHFLGQLRRSDFVQWLRPRAVSDGRGSGPRVASFELIERTTGVGWATVRDAVSDAQPVTARRKSARRFKRKRKRE
jgi:hypothetical protein